MSLPALTEEDIVIIVGKAVLQNVRLEKKLALLEDQITDLSNALKQTGGKTNG